MKKNKNKKFLIIGSNSFSGSHFVNHLLNLKYDVIEQVDQNNLTMYFCHIQILNILTTSNL